jgi:non-homologous end joining protein Ku
MLEKIVEEKVHAGGKKAPQPRKKAQPSNVVDLVSVL